jgi:SAM-dependent methyltransferase
MAFAAALRDVGVRAGFGDEMAWVGEILSWPVEWSALHGIAEIRLPILKISARTDATGRRYVVRRPGTSYPDEGASGLRFPYRAPTSVAAAARLVALRPAGPSWRYADNGFASEASMDRAQAPVVELAARAIGDGGNVLDLGCGNAMLLKKIRDRVGAGAIPFGVDHHKQHIAHARLVLPDFAPNFHVRDIFAGLDCSDDRRRYRLALVSVNRLLEVPESRARRLIAELRRSCDRLLVYRYLPADDESAIDAVAARLGMPVVTHAPEAVVVAWR